MIGLTTLLLTTFLHNKIEIVSAQTSTTNSQIILEQSNKVEEIANDIDIPEELKNIIARRSNWSFESNIKSPSDFFGAQPTDFNSFPAKSVENYISYSIEGASLEDVTTSPTESATTTTVKYTTTPTVDYTTTSYVRDTTTSYVEETTTSYVEDTTTSYVEDTTTSYLEDTTTSYVEDTTTSYVEDTTTSYVEDTTTSFIKDTATSFVEDTTMYVEETAEPNVEDTVIPYVEYTSFIPETETTYTVSTPKIRITATLSPLDNQYQEYVGVFTNPNPESNIITTTTKTNKKYEYEFYPNKIFFNGVYPNPDLLLRSNNKMTDLPDKVYTPEVEIAPYVDYPDYMLRARPTLKTNRQTNNPENLKMEIGSLKPKFLKLGSPVNGASIVGHDSSCFEWDRVMVADTIINEKAISSPKQLKQIKNFLDKLRRSDHKTLENLIDAAPKGKKYKKFVGDLPVEAYSAVGKLFTLGKSGLSTISRGELAKNIMRSNKIYS